MFRNGLEFNSAKPKLTDLIENIHFLSDTYIYPSTNTRMLLEALEEIRRITIKVGKK